MKPLALPRTTLIDVIGCPRFSAGFLFIPALLDFNDETTSSQRGSPKRLAIAEAFWALLLTQPFDLLPFHDHYYAEVEYDVMGTRKVGFDEFGFYDEALNYSVHDGHLGFATGDCRRCPDCRGLGEKQFFASLERCETCQGTGRIGWVKSGRYHESLAAYFGSTEER